MARTTLEDLGDYQARLLRTLLNVGRTPLLVRDALGKYFGDPSAVRYAPGVGDLETGRDYQARESITIRQHVRNGLLQRA
jgi:hypothetical protein